MFFDLLADLTVILHACFIAFVVVGGLLVIRWKAVAWVHIPAVIWAALIEFAGWVCPLTPLENWLRIRVGVGGYAGGFVQHYIVPVVYPAGLTRGIQIGLGVAVVVVNILAYRLAVSMRRKGPDIGAKELATPPAASALR
jgi:hypothetical protein